MNVLAYVYLNLKPWTKYNCSITISRPKCVFKAIVHIVIACFNTVSGTVCLYHHGSYGGGVGKIRLQTFHQHIIHPH
jgi:hypothetical protein